MNEFDADKAKCLAFFQVPCVVNYVKLPLVAKRFFEQQLNWRRWEDVCTIPWFTQVAIHHPECVPDFEAHWGALGSSERCRIMALHAETIYQHEYAATLWGVFAEQSTDPLIKELVYIHAGQIMEPHDVLMACLWYEKALDYVDDRSLEYHWISLLSRTNQHEKILDYYWQKIEQNKRNKTGDDVLENAEQAIIGLIDGCQWRAAMYWLERYAFVPLEEAEKQAIYTGFFYEAMAESSP